MIRHMVLVMEVMMRLRQLEGKVAVQIEQR